MRAQTPLTRLEMRVSDTGQLRAVIETPKGSRNKYKYDEDLDCFLLHKMLPLGACFPHDFGFLPSTYAEDGDPLDVLVLMEEPAFPGCVVPVRLVGVLEATQTEKEKSTRNDRLLAVLETPFNRPEITSLQELVDARLSELEHFFVSYNRMEGRDFKPIGRHGPQRALKIVEEGMNRFTKANS